MYETIHFSFKDSALFFACQNYLSAKSFGLQCFFGSKLQCCLLIMLRSAPDAWCRPCHNVKVNIFIHLHHGRELWIAFAYQVDHGYSSLSIFRPQQGLVQNSSLLGARMTTPLTSQSRPFRKQLSKSAPSSLLPLRCLCLPIASSHL